MAPHCLRSFVAKTSKHKRHQTTNTQRGTKEGKGASDSKYPAHDEPTTEACDRTTVTLQPE